MMPPSAFVSAPLPVTHRAPPMGQLASRFLGSVRAIAPPLRPPSHSPLMLFGLDFFTRTRKDTASLPQNDPEKKEREQAVKDAQLNYKWTQEGIADASLMEGVPEGEGIRLGWADDLVIIIVRTLINSALINLEDLPEDTERAIVFKVGSILMPVLTKIATRQFNSSDVKGTVDEIKSIVSQAHKGPATTLEDHKDLFNAIKLDTVGKNNQFLRDDIFGWYRVAGPNPMRITKFTGDVADVFPDFSDEILRGIPSFGGDSIAELLKEDRLYYVNYPEFEGVPTGKLDGKTKNQYNYAPFCLLGVPKNPTDRMTVLPLAIRCMQDKSYMMFTANEKHTFDITWIAAKLTVQVADSVIHEAVYHLARTHLLVGIFICATNRNLSERHPIFKLMKCHSYGTAFINNAAAGVLINPGGTIDNITAPDIQTTMAIAANGVNGESFKFNDWFPDVELKSRGVLSETLHFPYRDDMMEHWDALHQFVSVFIKAYYKSDHDVQNDYELANWCAEIVDPKAGNLHGFGDFDSGKVSTVDYLIRVVTMVIFTATVQHAAVNFPQSTMMQFAPSMPLGANAPPPNEPKPFKTLDEWVNKMVPELERSERQLNTAETIGLLVYGNLGNYGRSLEFAPDEVDEALEVYSEKLAEIGGRIQARNTNERLAGLPVYKYLVPKNIPFSINI